jgi:hypothetical protein
MEHLESLESVSDLSWNAFNGLRHLELEFDFIGVLEVFLYIINEHPALDGKSLQ